MFNWFHKPKPRTEPKRDHEARRLLPTTQREFDVWAKRIMDLAYLNEPRDAQQFALAGELLHLPPGTAMLPDDHFIFFLRKLAVNQVAIGVRERMYQAKVANTVPYGSQLN
jgi:hypothetical protein